MRPARSLLFILLLIIAGNIAAQTCSQCGPQSNGTDMTGKLTVYFDGSFTDADKQAIKDGIKLWNDYFATKGLPIGFTISTSPGDIRVFIDPSLHGSGRGALNTHDDTGKGQIGINPDFLNGLNMRDFLLQSSGHEFGHSVGFADVTSSSCYGYTIMHKNINSQGPFVTSLKTCDKAAVNSKYSSVTPASVGGTTSTDPQPIILDGSNSPIIINLEERGYDLTGLDDSVRFDLDADGLAEQTGWTLGGTRQGFLGLDLNDNGSLDDGRELFGDSTLLPDGTEAGNGFLALEQYDSNQDAWIDEGDAVWNRLLIWFDLNHNGHSESFELVALSRVEVLGLSLDHHWTGRRDRHGNTFRFESQVRLLQNGHERLAPVYDIFFVTRP